MGHSLQGLRTAAVALGFVALMMAPAGAAEGDGWPTFYTKTCLPPKSGCAASEAYAAGKKANQKLKCYARALGGREVSEGCLSDADEQFSENFDQAQDGGDCLSEISRSTLEDKVDCFVSDVLCEVTEGALCPSCRD